MSATAPTSASGNSPVPVSYYVHTEGPGVTGDAALPALTNARSYSPPVFDRIGESLRDHAPLAAAAGIAGGLAGVLSLRHGGAGRLLQSLGAVGGLLAGVGAVTGVATLLGGNRHTSPPAVAPAPSPSVKANERVKVMTYNLHGGQGGELKHFSSAQEMDALAKVIAREDPDVLIVQELDRSSVRSNFRNELGELTSKLHPDGAVAAASQTSIIGRQQEVGVMTFNGFTVSNARNLMHQDAKTAGSLHRMKANSEMLTDLVRERVGKKPIKRTPESQARNTIDTMVRTPKGTDVRVLSGHYQWPVDGRNFQEEQVSSVAQNLDGWTGATIMGADFNMRSSSPLVQKEIAALASAGLSDTFTTAGIGLKDARRGTSPNGEGIDRIYASHQAAVRDIHVVTDDEWASDHHPVVAELELRQTSGSP